jgi:hypothetical protein
MYLEINDTSAFKDIQEAFSNFYPYLRLEFYTRSHKKYEESLDIDLVDPATAIGDIKKTHVSGVLEIRPIDTVAQVETELNIRFGLSAQVFWKDKDVWRETTAMDDLTLKDLNEMGRNSSDEFIVTDYEEGFQEDEGFDRPVIK